MIQHVVVCWFSFQEIEISWKVLDRFSELSVNGMEE